MLRKRCARNAAARNVRRCSVQTAREGRDATRRERCIVAQFAHADRHIEVLGNQIDEPRGEVDLEPDRRVLEHELREHRREHEIRHVARHGHAEPAARLHLAVLRDTGVLKARKEANKVFYRINDPRVLEMIALTRRIFCSF